MSQTSTVSNDQNESLEPDLLTVDYSDQNGFHHQNLRDKFRVQAPIIVAGAFLAQCIVAIVFFGSLDLSPGITQSVAISAATNFIALVNYRRLRLFPGSRRLAFLLPAFGFPYAVVIACILWLRPSYSVLILAIGALVAVGLTWVFSIINRNPSRAPLLIVPSERTSAMLLELPHIHHEFCADPKKLADHRSTIVADLRDDLGSDWERALAQAALKGSTIYHVKQVWESLTGRVRIEHLSENSFGTLMPNSLYFGVKSFGCRLLGFFGLIVSAPIILIAALAIAIETKGSPIFKQRRVGFRGQPFTIYKLRTMQQTQGTSDEREAAITLVNDPRITKLGKFLRGTRIDELPQFLNMAKGDLCLIGPRPEAVPLADWYAKKLEFYDYRHVVKPGITGWAQVNQGHVASDQAVHRKLQYDFYYIKYFSLWLDILILCKTVFVILFRRGAK